MMISEFIERTGFEPTASEYAKIEKAYYDFNGNKDEFCKAFVMKRARITRVSKAAIAASRRYPNRNIHYFRNGNNEFFIIGGNNLDAFKNSGIAPTMIGVEHRLYINGRKIG